MSLLTRVDNIYIYIYIFIYIYIYNIERAFQIRSSNKVLLERLRDISKGKWVYNIFME